MNIKVVTKEGYVGSFDGDSVQLSSELSKHFTLVGVSREKLANGARVERAAALGELLFELLQDEHPDYWEGALLCCREKLSELNIPIGRAAQEAEVRTSYIERMHLVPK